MTIHPDERQLNDYADDTLRAAERGGVVAHVASCETCRAEIDRIRRLRSELAALPRDIAPPARVLAGVHAGIATADVGTIPFQQDRTRRPWHARPRLLAAAAVLLVTLSSGGTALLLRRPPAGTAGGGRAPASVMPAQSAQLTAVHAMERSYEDAIAEVQRVLSEGQSALAPETLRVLETNLAIIDRALAEARTALRADPGNDALAALLRAGYERKLDVLRGLSSHARGRS
jgi:anti-sigma factor RsiW